MARAKPKPGEAEAQLDALRRYFLWRYVEVAQEEYPIVPTAFPLVGSSRSDLVHVPGSGRVHFLFGLGDGRTHRSYVHSLTVGARDEGLEEEKRAVARHFGADEILVHLVVEPPFEQRFDEIEAAARTAVLRHARRPIRRGPRRRPDAG